MLFVLGFLANSGVSVVGLCAMDVVDASMVGSAHGLACAVVQGMHIAIVTYDGGGHLINTYFAWLHGT